MARPIRNLTEAKGFETALHNLASFGGSGGQFAVSLAKNWAFLMLPFTSTHLCYLLMVSSWLTLLLKSNHRHLLRTLWRISLPLTTK